MTTLKMDLDMVHGALSDIRTAYETYDTALSTLNGRITTMQAMEGWLGASANDFYLTYQSVQGMMQLTTEALKKLSLDLGSEITEWELMAQSLEP